MAADSDRFPLVPRLAVVGLLVLAACGDGDTTSDADAPGDTTTTAPLTLPLAEHFLDDPDVTTVATDLAPSQATGSTVPDPPAPDPCGLDDVEMWTAQVAADGSTAVLRLRNVSDSRCDVDIGRSPRIDPAIEPDVWLLPDETADLVVGPSTSECADPEVVDRVQVNVGAESVLVPTALVTCGWWLTAFYPNDDARGGCELADLDVAVTATTVVLRNVSPTSCRISGPVRVVGAELVAAFATGPVVRELLPGDVVSLGRPVGADCDGDSERVVLQDESFGELEVSNVSCAVVFELGSPRPWFGSEVGPVATLPDGMTDVPTVVAALDPFDGGQ